MNIVEPNAHSGRGVTLVQTPVVASHSVSIEMFWALLSQLMASFVVVAHLTMVT